MAHRGIALVVDDHPAALRTATRLLQRLGYEVLAFENPAEAIGEAITHSRGIDLLVTEIHLPEIKGPAIAQAVHRSKHVPTLYLSKLGNEEEHPGFVLPKPYDIHILAGYVQAIHPANNK